MNTQIRNDQLSSKLDALEGKMNTLQILLHEVLQNQEKILEEQQRTNGHVEFVESVYETVKKPFYRAMTMIHGKTIQPEAIEHKAIQHKAIQPEAIQEK
jgi:hypothetical protein